MLFDVQAALAEILKDAPACCDFRDSRDMRSMESQESQSQPLIVARPTGGLTVLPPSSVQPKNRGNNGNRRPDEITQPPAPSPQDEPPTDEHGRCHTWTGRVVHLDEWRQLSAWDRHGPAGWLFCGICQAWVRRGGGCGQAGCWKEHGGAA